MNLLDPISTIMSKDIITVSPDDNLKKAEDIFSKHRFHHLPVVDEGKLVGIVSKSDYLFFKRGFNDNGKDERIDLYRLKTRKMKDVMITGIATLEPNDKINVALEVFKENIFHAIPIVEDQKLRGMVTTLDIIRHLADDKFAENTYK